jgi:nitrogen regulatory protein PII
MNLSGPPVGPAEEALSMKMIWAIIRPEFVRQVTCALDRAGIGAMTRFPSSGPGDGPFLPAPFPPGAGGEMLMIAVSDCEVAKAVTIIRQHARPAEPGPAGADAACNGRVYVTHIDESLTIRTAARAGRESRP